MGFHFYCFPSPCFKSVQPAVLLTEWILGDGERNEGRLDDCRTDTDEEMKWDRGWNGFSETGKDMEEDSG